MLLRTHRHIQPFPIATPMESWRTTRLIMIALHAANIDDYKINAQPRQIDVHFRNAETKEKFMKSYEQTAAAQDRLNKPFSDASEQVTGDTAELTALDPAKFIKSRDWDLKTQIAFPKYTSADPEAKATRIANNLRQAASETDIDIYLDIRRPNPANTQQYVINVFAARDADMADFNKAYRRLSAEKPPELPKPPQR